MRAPVPHVLLAVALAARAAAADPPAEEPGVTVRADRVTQDRARVESSPRFATSIDLRDRGPLAPSVAELLDEAPGLHTRSNGDALLPTTVSVRGAPAGHVTVALDGVVLNDANGEGVDLSLVPPALLERADVYRGAAPARLGVSGLGGAVELVTRAPGSRSASWVSAGYGSFGQRRVSAAATGGTRAVRGLFAVSYRGTDGDFPFYDDHGTPLSPADDRPDTTRVNNAGNAVDALYRLCARAGRGDACLLALAGWREHGLPGPGSAQYTAPAIAQRRALVRGSYRVRAGASTLEAYAAATARGDHFTDPSRQVIGQVIDAQSSAWSAELGLTGSVGGRDAHVEPVVRARWERFDAAGIQGEPLVAGRASALVGADATVRRGAFEGVGAVAVEALRDDTTTAAAIARVLTSPRAGLRVVLPRGFELRANAAHLERAPTLQELYGVGGYVSGNPALRPERSDGADAGAVFARAAGGWSARVEADGFVRRSHDLIVLVRGSALAQTPVNLQGADAAGVEAALRVSYRAFASLVASYGFTHAVTRAPGQPTDGLSPPSIPAHDLYVRAQGAAGFVSGWVDLSYVSGIYFDEANQAAAPPRTLLGAALSVRPPFARSLALTVLGSNLLDQREAVVTVRAGAARYDIPQAIADFAGYPLPGRSLFVALTFSTEPSP